MKYLRIYLFFLASYLFLFLIDAAYFAVVSQFPFFLDIINTLLISDIRLSIALVSRLVITGLDIMSLL